MAKQWLDTTEYPFESNYFETDGQKLHYIDEGQGDILLFVHGTPSWSFDFRNVIKPLSRYFRCIAIDHIGFGLSDKPASYNYSTLKHSQTLESFILSMNLDNLTLILHDFGGPIGFNFAIRYPERIRGMAVLNSWLWSSKNDPDFIKLSRVLKSPLLPLLYRHFNFSPRFILPQSFGEKKLSRKLLKQFTSPFENKEQRNGALAFARSLLNDQDWFEELWHKRNALTGIAILFIWGMKDPVVKPHVLDKFLSGFCEANVVRLSTSGHFPQEEEPDTVAKAILSFMQLKHPIIQSDRDEEKS